MILQQQPGNEDVLGWRNRGRYRWRLWGAPKFPPVPSGIYPLRHRCRMFPAGLTRKGNFVHEQRGHHPNRLRTRRRRLDPPSQARRLIAPHGPTGQQAVTGQIGTNAHNTPQPDSIKCPSSDRRHLIQHTHPPSENDQKLLYPNQLLTVLTQARSRRQHQGQSMRQPNCSARWQERTLHKHLPPPYHNHYHPPGGVGIRSLVDRRRPHRAPAWTEV